MAMGGGWNDGYQPGDAGKVTQSSGRWPANILFSHSPTCTDVCDPSCCPVAELDAQSGNARSSGVYAGDGSRRPGHHSTDFGGGDRHRPAVMYGDSGGASRFFPVFRYQAKAPTAQRPSYVKEGAGDPRSGGNFDPNVVAKVHHQLPGQESLLDLLGDAS